VKLSKPRTFFQVSGILVVYFQILFGFANDTDLSGSHDENRQNISEEYRDEYYQEKKLNPVSQIVRQDLQKEFDSLIKKSVAEDRSCLNVVSGNSGEKSFSEIQKAHGAQGNVSDKELKIKDYPGFMAKNFLGMLCQNKQFFSKKNLNDVDVRNIHPYQRVTLSKLDAQNDALSKKEFRDPLDKLSDLSVLPLAEHGLHNLIFGHALVYSLVIRESKAELLMLEQRKLSEYLKGDIKKPDRDSALAQKVGLCHQSANSMGSENDMEKKSPLNTLFPYAADLLKQYIKKARYLASDKSPDGFRKFSDFCGTSHFEERYKEKGVNPQNSLLAILASTTEFITVSKTKKLLTCDEIIESGIISYDAKNVHSCYMALQEYCPSYSIAHANLVVRGLRMNNGPLHKTSRGVRPACHNLFYKIYKRVTEGDNLCKLAEDFSM
jgi:hypothetical protein